MLNFEPSLALPSRHRSARPGLLEPCLIQTIGVTVELCVIIGELASGIGLIDCEQLGTLWKSLARVPSSAARTGVLRATVMSGASCGPPARPSAKVSCKADEWTPSAGTKASVRQAA